uniref:non-specific serine/threonine protein kinase n=1 Tax=Urocitellus parryii TaxID=9999 RepID=A0A8D2HQT7_UROPR
MVMEHGGGGRLLDYVPEGGLQEEEARRLFRQIVSAVGYCHDRGFVHRDLKPENIVLDARGQVKLIDFGFSTTVHPGQKLREFWGTLSHFAPEIILRQAYEGSPPSPPCLSPGSWHLQTPCHGNLSPPGLGFPTRSLAPSIMALWQLPGRVCKTILVFFILFTQILFTHGNLYQECFQDVYKIAKPSLCCSHLNEPVQKLVFTILV